MGDPIESHKTSIPTRNAVNRQGVKQFGRVARIAYHPRAYTAATKATATEIPIGGDQEARIARSSVAMQCTHWLAEVSDSLCGLRTVSDFLIKTREGSRAGIRLPFSVSRKRTNAVVSGGLNALP